MGYRTVSAVEALCSMRRRSRAAGYLLVLVTSCMAVLTIGYLRLAATAGKSDVVARQEIAASSAYYAAESGLVVAVHRVKHASLPPSTGSWLTGSLDTSGSRYEVEVLSALKKSPIEIRSTGVVVVADGTKISVSLEALLMKTKGPKGSWRMVGVRKVP